MSENSPKDGKSGSPKVAKKPGVGSPKAEVKKTRSRKLKVVPTAIGSPKLEVGSPKLEVGGPKPEAEKPSAANPHAPTEPKQLQTENRSLQTEQMEVHHHPDLHHEKKPWKEYLLEGLMIFFAVFMGFIAENIREGIDNNEHARQLTSQLVRDLKANVIQLDQIDSAETVIVKANDSLFNLLQQPLAKADTKKIQKLIIDSHNMWPFHPSLGAIGAIKNELHLKQFSNSEIIDYIATYEGHIDLLRTAQDVNMQYQRIYLDPFLRLHFTPANLHAAFSPRPILSSQMRNLTQEDLTQLGADMVLVKIVTNELIKDQRKCRVDAVKLLQYVTKQYHLENE